MSSILRKIGIVALLPILMGCSSNEGTTSPDQAISKTAESSFTWSEDALFQAAIPSSEFETWGFLRGPGSQSGTGEISLDSANLLYDEVAITNPAECLPMYSFYAPMQSSLPGKYYLFQEQYDGAITNYMKVLVVAFESESEAKSTFEQIVSLKDTCKGYESKRGSELRSIYMWDSLDINDPDYIQGEHNGIPVAFGIVGSAVFYQEAITPSGSEDVARNALSASRVLLTANLQKAQGQ